MEREGVEEGWREASDRGVSLGRRDKHVLAGQFGQRVDLWLGGEQPMPAYRFIDHGERIGLAFAGFRERRDRAPKKAHELANVAGCCLVAPFLAAPGAREQGADKLVEHLHRGVRQPRLEIDQARDEHRSATAGRVIGEQEGRRRGALAHELPEAVLVNGAHDVGGDAERAHEGEPLDNAIDVRRRRQLRNVAQPCERGGVEFDVVDEKPVEATELLGRQRRDKGIGRAPSSLGHARPEPSRSIVSVVGRMSLAARSPSRIPRAIGSPLSVDHAAAAARSRAIGTSARMKVRRPRRTASSPA